MATTSNTYTGNGSNKLFSITFPYLETTDVDVYLNGTLQTITTQYTFANATTIEFVAAPANGAVVLLDRSTDDATLQATFFPGSSIKAADLNLDFDQVLYIAQETSNEATTATSTAATATTTANTALSQSAAAVSTANTASSNASAAVSTANTASTNASNAVTTANTASSNATTAVNTANAATSTANSAASNASTALSTANTALTNANSAVTTANTASSNATAAVSTANTASTNASNAVTTANSAVTTANGAVTTANTANTNSNTAITTANAAAAAVANAVLYTTVANVAAISGSPANNAAVEVTDSTGIESFTPLSGLPAGFIGSSGLSVRIIYQTSGATWTWIQYFPNDPEARYFKLAGGTLTGALASTLGTAALPSLTFTGDTNTGIYSPGADQVAISTNGTGRVFVDSAGKVGVGASPTQLLQLGAFGGNDSNLQFAANTAGASNILFGDGSSGADFYRGFIKYNHATDSLELVASSYSTITTNGSERLRIDSSGRVGIGTSSPWSTFTVGSGGSANPAATATIHDSTHSEYRLKLTSTAFNSSGNWLGLGFGYSDNYLKAGIIAEAKDSNARANLHFCLDENVNNANANLDDSKMVITYDGKVGIGTTGPDSKLHVVDASGNGLRIGYLDSINLYDAPSHVFRSNTASANAERVRIDSSGRLGIGTSSPNALLDVNGQARFGGNKVTLDTDGSIGCLVSNATTRALILTNTNVSADYFGGRVFQIGPDGTINIGGTAGTNPSSYSSPSIKINPAGSSYFTGGSLGIGTTSPSDPSGFGNCIDIRSPTGAAIYLRDSDDTVNDAFVIGRDNSDSYLISASGNMLFLNNGSERARIDSSGRLLVGTSTGHGTLQVHDGTFVLSKPATGSERNWRLLPSAAAAGDLAIQQSTTAGGTTYSSKLAIGANGSFSSVIPGGSTLYPQFACRAWVNYNRATQTINGSANVSSVTASSTGTLTVNFSTAMPDSNYSVTHWICKDNENNDSLIYFRTTPNSQYNQYGFTGYCSWHNASGAFGDFAAPRVTLAVFR